MIFWKKPIYAFSWHVFSLLIELGVIYYFCGLHLCLLISCLVPAHLLISFFLLKSQRFNNHILTGLLFYLKIIGFTFILTKMLPDIFGKLELIRVFLGIFLSFFIFIFLKIFTGIGIISTGKSIMFCSTGNLTHYFSLYPRFIKKFFTKENKNAIDLIKTEITKKNTQMISVDLVENALLLINQLNGQFVDINIDCLELGNNNLFEYVFDQRCVHLQKATEVHNFFGARVLIISNNEQLILNFVKEAYSLECSSLTLVTDCVKIFEKFNSICKTILFSRDIKFRDIESKYTFDIIFDAYIIRSYNFTTYRMIIKEISEVVKNKKAIVSVVKHGMFIEDWLFNKTKEIVLKKFYDTCFGLTVIAFRCGEFSPKNFFPIGDNFILSRDFLIQSPESIAYSSWKTLWSVEKSSFNILSNSIPADSKMLSAIALRIREMETHQKLTYETLENYQSDSIEALNQYFFKHNLNFSMAMKTLADHILENKDEISSEDIAKAIFS